MSNSLWALRPEPWDGWLDEYWFDIRIPYSFMVVGDSEVFWSNHRVRQGGV